VRRERGCGSALTLVELVEEYLAQHDGEPETIEKLRWLLSKPVKAFGGRRLPDLRAQEIAAWRMTIPKGHRFEATQALRQVLARAVVWGMIDINPAKHGVDNPQRRYTEKRPFESWAELNRVAAALGSPYGPMVMFAAATGLRPGEWIALEQRDVDPEARVVYVRRPSETADSSARRPKPASVPSPCRPPPSQHSSNSPPRAHFCSLRPGATTSIYTTSAIETGNPTSKPPGSRRFAASTIYGTRSRHSRFVPASRPSTFRATWERA
jgi:hypothetical protein